jgi:hypothetical protein
MNCGNWEEKLALAAGGDLPEAEAAELEQHLAVCADCRETAAAYGWSLNLLREAHAEPLNPAHYAAVRARVIGKLEQRRSRAWAWRWAAGLAAVALAVTLAPWNAGRPGHTGGEGRAVAHGTRVSPKAAANPPVEVAEARPSVRYQQFMNLGPARPRTARAARPTASAAANVPAAKPGPPAEPLVIKLFTDDPDVVIYWLTN